MQELKAKQIWSLFVMLQMISMGYILSSDSTLMLEQHHMSAKVWWFLTITMAVTWLISATCGFIWHRKVKKLGTQEG